MPQQTFRGDPYRVLEVASDASESTIKRRWRQLAREHHPDRAAGDPAEARRLTSRMARINAAYDLLRDAERRARYDASRGTWPRGRAGDAEAAWGDGASDGRDRDGSRTGTRRPVGPPPPPPTRPVTGRFDTTELFHRRNTVPSPGGHVLRGQRPVSNREREEPAEPLRASSPNGPVERRAARGGPLLPSLADARATVLEFGKFRGHTLGEVEIFEPTYVDWIARTITRDRDLVIRARVIQSELDRRGVERRPRAATAGSGAASPGP